ncbi:hypothetical protein KO494_03995 [Lacinutrix sp. C3R15]|uniref:hypothetical protein n=1 Tax=Flavobacteriaceae TaxID=49546 RepID=UPI001C08D468|nr:MULTISPECIES: hypothetical protein [Flavobacteriaceae]MBU2938697.1 hypothetical protein [Lacinutrix sp. C3R15]MDO6622011.1 hypothetical protein [Oceanihabitans sp. 1_MG-2023]
MKKYYLIFSVALVSILSMSSSSENKALNEKVTICHIPPENPSNYHEITVSVHAICAHIAHGDLISTCTD